MTLDDIIRMAQEARLGTILTHQRGKPRVWIEGADWHDELERFAALVAAAEREECAEVCDEYAKNSSNPMNFAENCAKAIRARGNK